VHSMRPIAFSLALSESEEAYEKLFRCTVEAVKQVYGFDLVIHSAVSDHSQARVYYCILLAFLCSVCVVPRPLALRSKPNMAMSGMFRV